MAESRQKSSEDTSGPTMQVGTVSGKRAVATDRRGGKAREACNVRYLCRDLVIGCKVVSYSQPHGHLPGYLGEEVKSDRTGKTMLESALTGHLGRYLGTKS